jgi:hypothetical protein
MSEQTSAINPGRPRTKIVYQGASQAVYGLGFIGSLVYFMQHAANLGMVLLGILKAMVWPALVAYKLLEFLKL